MKNQLKAKSVLATNKRRRIVFVTIGVLVLVVGFFAAKIYLDRPQNLGAELEYIGRVNTTCEWWEIPIYAGFCPGPRYLYYFATDMSEEELKGYFKAEVVDIRRSNENTELIFEIPSDKQYRDDFVVDIPRNTQEEIQKRNLKQTNKQNIISIPKFDYDIAKSAL